MRQGYDDGRPGALSGLGISLCMLLTTLLACLGPGPSWEAAPSVLAADRARAAAMQSVDLARLDSLLHASLSYAHANGSVDSKATLLTALATGRVRYRSIEVGEAAVRIHGSSALLTAPAEIEVEADGRLHHFSGIYTAVYWWQSGRWQLVAYHSSAPPQP